MSISSCEAVPERAAPDLMQQLRSTVATLFHWKERVRQRRQLRSLAENVAFLKDVGISQGDAMIEANKPFWKD